MIDNGALTHDDPADYADGYVRTEQHTLADEAAFAPYAENLATQIARSDLPYDLALAATNGKQCRDTSCRTSSSCASESLHDRPRLRRERWRVVGPRA
jgi:hypothetical protein